MTLQHPPRTGLPTISPRLPAHAGHRPHRPGPPPHRGRAPPQRFQQHPTELHLRLALLQEVDPGPRRTGPAGAAGAGCRLPLACWSSPKNENSRWPPSSCTRPT